MEYFVIGEREIVLGFGLVGVSGQVAVSRAEVLDAFMRITGQGGAVAAMSQDGRPDVLILTESASSLIEDELVVWQMGGKYPLVVEIPGLSGHMRGKRSLTDAIREAVGIHV